MRSQVAPEVRLTIALGDRKLTARIAVPVTLKWPGLVFFATGDAGWYGASSRIFRAIAGHGYRVVGISSWRYRQIRHDTVTHVIMATDVTTILCDARRYLKLSNRVPVVVSGFSLGAAYAVLGAADERRRARLTGLVALGMPGAEDFERERALQHGTGAWSPYQTLRAMSRLRRVVIQATGHRYLRAISANERFGPDTNANRFFSVESCSHGFRGNAVGLDQAIDCAFAWITESPLPLTAALRSPSVRRSSFGRGPSNLLERF